MKRNNALLVIVGLSIFSNLFKTAHVFRSVSFGEHGDYLQWSYAVFSVLILEVSILVLLANGSKLFPLLFAICTFAINVYYFNQFQFGDISQNIIEVIFAGLFPAIIYRFSELYYSSTNEVQPKFNEIQRECDNIQDKYDALNTDYVNLQAKFNEVQENSDNWLEVVTCKKCGKVHHSPSACNSHQYRCTANQ